MLRMAASTLILFCMAHAFAQTSVWSGVKPELNRPRLDAAHLSDAQRKALQRLMRASPELGGWQCDPSETVQLLEKAQLEELPVSPQAHDVLIEAPAGCARGGQGSNGGMWIAEFQGSRPRWLATPKIEFNGWLFSIQPQTSHGYHDIVLGWHMGADDAGLDYFRFDGTRYRSLGGAELTTDENGKGVITPK